MTRTPESTAKKAASRAARTDLLTEMEESVHLATACIRLLTELAIREIECHSPGGTDKLCVPGLLILSADVSDKLHHSFRALHREMPL